MPLANKVAIVTGAASGIGAGIAERFVEAGAAVTVFDINGEGARKVAERLGAQGATLAIEGDVADDDAAKAAVQKTVERFGELDILINNAGMEAPGTVVDLTSEGWDRQLAVNLKGIFLFSKHAIPHMKGRGGAIVNISSVHALVSYPGDPAYDASKAGLLGLTRAMALDHGQDKIRVNAICPGYIQTPLLDKWLDALPDREETMQRVMQAHPLGRIGNPRDIADAALFLVSDAASFITGTYLVVDGGMIAAGH